MEKQTIASIVGFAGGCLFLGIVIGIYLIPRSLANQAARDAARSSAASIVQQTNHESANQSANEAARDIASKIVSTSKSEANASPFPPQDKLPVIVQRQAFSITLPNGCYLDPADPEIGSERMVIANFPHHSYISITVADSRAAGSEIYDALLAKYRAAVENAEEMGVDTLESLRMSRATGVRGTIKTIKYCYEIGQCEGWDKSYVFVAEYPDEDRGLAAPLMRKAIATFKMKQ